MDLTVRTRKNAKVYVSIIQKTLEKFTNMPSTLEVRSEN